MLNRCVDEKPLSQASAAAIAALRDAFEECPRPQSKPEFSSVGGIDRLGFFGAWPELLREAVVGLEDSFLNGGEVGCMSSIARRYFFPELMIRMLLRPDGWDYLTHEELFHLMERMWAEPPDAKYARCTQLTVAQAKAVAAWCEAMQRSALFIDELEDDEWGSYAEERSERLAQLDRVREGVPNAVEIPDFDADWLAEVREEARKAQPYQPSRRKGWQRFKGKDGRRRGE